MPIEEYDLMFQDSGNILYIKWDIYLHDKVVAKVTAECQNVLTATEESTTYKVQRLVSNSITDSKIVDTRQQVVDTILAWENH